MDWSVICGSFKQWAGTRSWVENVQCCAEKYIKFAVRSKWSQLKWYKLDLQTSEKRSIIFISHMNKM